MLPHEVLLRLRLEPELGQVERQVALVENSHHDLLAVEHRQGRDAEVDDAVPHLELEAPVLRHPPLGDVELREDLDARGERRPHLERRPHDLQQRAVDPVAHPDLVLERLDVDVAGAPLDRLDQQSVDQLHHRRVLELRLGDGLFFLLFDDLEVLAGRLHVLEEALELLLVVGLVVLLDQSAEGELTGDDRKEVEPGDELEVFEQAHVAGVGHGDRERAALALEREHDALGGHVGGHQLEDLGVDVEARQVHRGHAVLSREDLGDLELGDEAQLDQHETQTMLRRLLLRERLNQLLAREKAIAQEDFAEPVTATGGCGRHGPVGSGAGVVGDGIRPRGPAPRAPLFGPHPHASL